MMRSKIGTVFVLILLTACYIAAGSLGIQAHKDPGEMDTPAYLSAAWQIHETGGVLGHIQNCLNGVYREATQHPVYLLLLSPFASHDIHFFVRAKIVSFFIGLLFLAVLFWVVRSLFGSSCAFLTACLLLMSAMFINLSTLVACESLLVLFFILFWFFAARGFEKGKYWLWAGFFSGAAFLTKSLAILILPVFLFLAIFLSRPRRRLFSNKYFWGFFAVFFLVSSPLLIRNAKVFGAPFYSDSSAVLWLDRWHDYYRADIKQNPPTLFSYLETHSPGNILSTFFTGFFVRNPKMISDGLKPFPFWERPLDLEKLQGFYVRTAGWQWLWSGLIVFLALWGWWKKRKHPAAVIAAASLGFFLVFVAWYSKVFPGYPPTRLLYPIVILIVIFASSAVSDLGKVKWAQAVAGIFAIIYLVSLAANFDWRTLDLRRSYAFTNPFVAQLFWAGNHLREGDTLMVGSVFTSYYFYFEEKLKGKIIAWPQAESLEELEDFIRTRSVRYGILDLPTVAYNLKVYQKYYDVGPHIGMNAVAEMPPPFFSVFKDPHRPRLYEIYEFR